MECLQSSMRSERMQDTWRSGKMSDFDKSDQKKTEYVLVDIYDVEWNNTELRSNKSGRKIMQGRIQDEINKRPSMRLVNIIPFSPRFPSGNPAGNTMLHLLFEERDHNLDSIRKDIEEMKKHIEKIAYWADRA